MKWLRKTRSFWSLSPVRRRRTLEALAALCVVSSSLRLRGYVATHRWLEARLTGRRQSAGDIGPAELDTAIYLGQAVEVAAGNLPYSARCLERSLALWWMLGRRRICSDLRIGVRKSTAGLEAHAWIEVGGQQINDGSDVGERYAAFEGGISPGPTEPR